MSDPSRLSFDELIGCVQDLQAELEEHTENLKAELERERALKIQAETQWDLLRAEVMGLRKQL